MTSRVIKVLFYLGVLMIFGTLLSGLNIKSVDKSAATKGHRTKHAAADRPFKMEGFSYRSYNGDRLVASIEADEFKIDRRKFWIFNIQPFKEATFKRANLKLYQGNSVAGSDEEGLMMFGKDFLKLDGMEQRRGLVSRGIINGLTLEIFDADQPSILVSARKAYIDPKKKMVRMQGVRMKDISSGSEITSRFINWNHQERKFRIPGEYVARSGGKVKEGKMVKVGLDFDISPLNET
jgi:hypothetical protein